MSERPETARPDTGTVIAGLFEPPLMELRGVGYRVGGQALLSGVDLKLRAGARTCLIGPNGAGKSLLLRLMHGLIAPSAGRILWRGEALGRTGRNAQAMVFQSPVMLRRSVRANLNFALSVQGFAGRERARRAERALEMAGLTGLEWRAARVLSGGQQQRLAIARALAGDPALLLLDEPTASLDPAATAQVEELIAAAHAEGVTIVMTSHDRGQVRRVADDVVFLSAGAVVETGPCAQVLDAPVHPATRAWATGALFIPPEPGDGS